MGRLEGGAAASHSGREIVRDRLQQRFSALPGVWRWVIGVGSGTLLLVGIFVVVVLPLLVNSGVKAVELNSEFPASGKVGQQLQLVIPIDNTGDQYVHPICVKFTFDAPVDVQAAVFQNFDKVPYSDGKACGGGISTQETTNINLVVVPRQAGALHVVAEPLEGDKPVGAKLQGTIQISP